MVGFAKVEDRPTPASVYGARIYLAAITAAAAAIMIGYDSLVFIIIFHNLETLSNCINDLCTTALSSEPRSLFPPSKLNLDWLHFQPPISLSFLQTLFPLVFFRLFFFLYQFFFFFFQRQQLTAIRFFFYSL